jgi:alpha-glucosidase
MTHPWWRGAIIYQIYPRSFRDSNGDGIGDLPGIIAGLDHVAELGVDAIWISPFFRSPMKDFGYDVADYREVDPIFGTNADFDRLIAEAHARGLRVLIDLVLPHTSDQHPWFQESRTSRDNPRADWYVWADARPDGTPPNNWLSVFGGPSWQWEVRRQQYYLHHFLREQPNLNWHNPAVVDAMLAEAKFWLDRGIDGFRLDAITTLVHDPLLRDNPPRDPTETRFDNPAPAFSPFRYQDHVHDRDQPPLLAVLERLHALVEPYGACTMGEIADVDSVEATARYTSARASRLHTGYSFLLTQPAFDRQHLGRVVDAFESQVVDGWTTYAFSNHDVPRAVSRWGVLPELSGDREALAAMLLACLFSLRGSACMYQGEELGLTESVVPRERMVDPWGIELWPLFPGRDGSRTPIPWRSGAPSAGFTTGAPWLPIPDEHHAMAVEAQAADPDSVLASCRRLLRFRKAHPALRTGTFAFLDTPAPLWAFVRSDEHERLLCVLNLSNKPATWTIEDGWTPLQGHGFPSRLEDTTLHLPPFGVFFGGRARG